MIRRMKTKELKRNALKILGATYEIVLLWKNDLNAGGTCDVGAGKIRLGLGYCREFTESTVIHEVIEVINYRQQMELPHPKIMALESALFSALKDNGVDLSPLLAKCGWTEAKARKGKE